MGAALATHCLAHLHLQLDILCCPSTCATAGWHECVALTPVSRIHGRMEQAKRAANVRYFSNRQKGRKRATPMQIVALRIADLSTLFRSRYGTVLPDDDAGRDDIRLAVDHLAALAHPARAITRWLETWAPWMTLGEQRQVIADGIAGQRNWKADALAWRLRLTKEERTMLGITTIGAIDHGKAARKKRRKERERERQAAKRRAAGAVPRAQYEGQSLEKQKPWLAEGISRRTWYRRRLNDVTTS